jgi:hypothetical protein
MSGAGAGATPPAPADSGRGALAKETLSSKGNSLFRAPRTGPPGWDWRRERAAVCERSSPLANGFPLGDTADLEALADDLVANGQRFPILRYEGQLVDGRRRDVACRWAGLDPEYADLDGLDQAAVAALVLSLNAHRRHNTRVDLALSAARCIGAAEAGGVSRTRLASALGINRQAVFKAEQVLKHCPELEREVRTYQLSLERAYGRAREAARGRATAADAAPPRRRGRPLTPIAPEKVPRRLRALWEAVRRTDPLAVAASLQTEAQAAAVVQHGEGVQRHIDLVLSEIRRRWPGVSGKGRGSQPPPTR